MLYEVITETDPAALGADDSAARSALRSKRMTKQMLINLLTNAVKFTPKGGEVA